MVRIDWDEAGSRYFEAGVDRGVLYVDDNAGVPWIGLTAVNESSSGGEAKPKYIDGVKISNHSSPEEFEASIEALTYPIEFEQCDGTTRIQNGLRTTQQRRKQFGMVYRTKIGNELKGLEYGYKLHILYNLSAKPSDRGYQSLSDQNQAMAFSWDLTSRGELVIGLKPVSHFIIDSRDVPTELLGILENILYGDEDQDASLPSPGELIFLFDAYNDLVYDAGDPFTPVFATYDAGTPTTAVTSTIDGGAL